MTIDELQKLLDVSSDHACCIDIRNVDGALGYVRTVSIHDGARVNIEFDVWGMDEGGLYYWALFSSLQDAVDSVADYIGRPIGDWTDSPCYPERPSDTGLSQSHDAFKQLLAENALQLPDCGKFRTESEYWLQFFGPTSM